MEIDKNSITSCKYNDATNEYFLTIDVCLSTNEFVELIKSAYTRTWVLK